MGCFSCFDSRSDEQLGYPKQGRGGGGNGADAGGRAAAASSSSSGVGRRDDRPMVAPRVEKLPAGACVSPIGLLLGWWVGVVGSDP